MDGEYWIKTFRQKTEVPVNVPVLQPAMSIIKKYRNDPLVTNQNRLLPLFSNQKVNQYLKEIAKASEIEKYISFPFVETHFYNNFTLTNGIPIETVSKMLGHTY